jgi:hypothetical protein
MQLNNRSKLAATMTGMVMRQIVSSLVPSSESRIKLGGIILYSATTVGPGQVVRGSQPNVEAFTTSRKWGD